MKAKENKENQVKTDATICSLRPTISEYGLIEVSLNIKYKTILTLHKVFIEISLSY